TSPPPTSSSRTASLPRRSTCWPATCSSAAPSTPIKAGVWHRGSWCWWRDTERKEQTAAIGYEVNTLDPAGPWLRLSDTTTRTGEALDDRVGLQTTRLRFGGVRWWFTCPLVLNGVPCNRCARSSAVVLLGHASSSRSDLASRKSGMSNPSVNQP